MEAFDQLLTCCVCLDRYKNPKLLPCQHSYCMEPCMEGLVDYVKRQVKCPECRAEHRIPYNGIQGFPSNYTLQKFLELHAEITGELPDPNQDAIMSRCNVCSEKAYVNPCAHCDKKCCEDCREAHCDILKREISRVNNQVKRGWHRLEDCVQQIDRNNTQLSSNATTVLNEIEEMHTRLTNVLKERTEFLKSSVDKYLIVESKTLKDLKENLELELANIKSNADLMENHMSDGTKWDDAELMDTKDIFIKMMDFIRNYDPGTEEYTRRIRFTTHEALNDLAKRMLEVGDLKFYDPKPKNDRDDDLPIRSTGLSRSKSDHRLVAEFRRREEVEEKSPPRRRFGDTRYSREDNKSRTNFGGYGEDDDTTSSSATGGRFRSRFLRGEDEDESGTGNRNSTYDEGSGDKKKPDRIKVVDTEDCSRGPLSGCIRLADSSRVIQRLKEYEMSKIKPPKEKEKPLPIPKFVPLKPNLDLINAPLKPRVDQPPASTEKPATAATTPTTPTAAPATSMVATQAYTTPAPAPARPAVAPSRTMPNIPAAVAASQPVPSTTTPAVTPAIPATSIIATSSTTQRQQSSDSSISSAESEENKAPQAAVEDDDDEYEYYEYDSEEEEEEEVAPAPAPAPIPPKSAMTAPKPPERKTSYAQSSTTAAAAKSTPAPAKPTPAAAKLAPTAAKPAPAPAKPTPAAAAPAPKPAVTPAPTPVAAAAAAPSNTGIRAYGGARTMPNIPAAAAASQPELGLSPDAAAEAAAASQPSNESNEAVAEMKGITARYRRLRDDSDSFVNKYLAKSRQASVDPSENRSAAANSYAANPATSQGSSEHSGIPTKKISGDNSTGGSRSRYAALRDRRAKVARSKSTAVVGFMGYKDDEDDEDDDDDDDDDDNDDNSLQTPFTSRFGRELAKSRSSHFLKSSAVSDTDASDSGLPSSSSAGGMTSEDDNLSSWARYLKNKYGSKTKKSGSGRGDNANNTNEQVNNQVNRNNQQKQSLLMTFGSRGSQPGLFTWPRGIAVNPTDNSIVVADSSNHRVQVFNEQGQHRFSFGCYGNGEGEFDCLAGVAVNKIGQYIIADRYNHRIQIFDATGHFIRSFGSQGTVDGKFSYPWGITTDALGLIYVCDKENHRVQVFQSDGSFVSKFGVMGSKPGNLEHPHYIAVSNTNRVIVSDSNNHRIQIFDVNGKVLTTFGSEGTDAGQFKFPRGVSVDEKNYIYVADSGNNRIQIFNPDGTFLRCFGRWGQGEGEFKGLEGIAVNSKGNTLVADRENHRVQIF